MNNPDEFLSKIGKRIVEQRKRLKYSQEELSEKADVSPQLLSTAERGTKALRPENLLKISKALGVSTDYLLTGDVVDKDLLIISKKLEAVSSNQLHEIESIIDSCLNLCDK